jgi:hypothetical protein
MECELPLRVIPQAGVFSMALSLFDNRGSPLDKQHFTWRDMVQKPISKLDDDAYTRAPIILMNGLEMEALRRRTTPAWWT